MAIEILNIDCMEYMAGLEDNAFDLAIVDPPYGMDRKMDGTGGAGRIMRKWKRVTTWDVAPGAEYFNAATARFEKETAQLDMLGAV